MLAIETSLCEKCRLSLQVKVSKSELKRKDKKEMHSAGLKILTDSHSLIYPVLREVSL